MSFLTEAAARRVATLQVVPRAFATTSVPRAAFSSSVTLQKSVVDSTKETLKTVDRAVSDKLVDGINIGSTVANKLKEATEDVTSGQATGKAQQLRAETSGKTSEMAGKAKGAASEMAGEAEGTASKVAGQAQGTAEKYAGKAKGAAEQARQQL